MSYEEKVAQLKARWVADEVENVVLFIKVAFGVAMIKLVVFILFLL